MPSSPGHVASHSLTNGHSSPLAINVAPAVNFSPPSESELSDVKEHAAEEPSSDEDAPGEQDDDDDAMQVDSDSSEDVDAEGEPDGDYDSETPPPIQVESSRARSSTSQESRRPPKRKASVEGDDFMTQNPELYGLRRSVRGCLSVQKSSLTLTQGRARPTRRIVRDSYQMEKPLSNNTQVDSSDDDDQSESDAPRKRQRTASRKGDRISNSSQSISTDANTPLQPRTSLLQSTGLPIQTPIQMATSMPVEISPRRSRNFASCRQPPASSLPRKPKYDFPRGVQNKSPTTMRMKRIRLRKMTWKT